MTRAYPSADGMSKVEIAFRIGIVVKGQRSDW
jgi:hypothetical protein